MFTRFQSLIPFNEIFMITSSGAHSIVHGWADFFSDGPNFIKILYFGSEKKILPYFFLHKDHIIDVNYRYFTPGKV